MNVSRVSHAARHLLNEKSNLANLEQMPEAVSDGADLVALIQDWNGAALMVRELLRVHWSQIRKALIKQARELCPASPP